MGALSLRARLARWIGGNAVKSAEQPPARLDATEEGPPDRESLPVLDRLRVIEAEMLDLSVQWSDLNDAVRKWSARLASQKAAETRKALSAMEEGSAGGEATSDGQPEAEGNAEERDLANRARMKAELARRWANRGKR
jgi:hypothetical protein